MIDKNYNKICKALNCPQYIAWNGGYEILISCRKIGQTENIDKYPKDCNFIDILKISEATRNE